MHALLFEMKPREGHEDHYFKHAAALRPLLDQQDGLIVIDRFKSLSRPGVILSHSLWRDEASLAKWRTDAQHHKSQAAGRNQHFEDYRIRISHVLEHASRGDPAKHWSNDGSYCSSESRAPSFLVIVGSKHEPFSDKGEAFLSVNFEDTYVNIIEADNESSARTMREAAGETENVQTAMFSLVSRDYSMFDRAEAPQYFPPINEAS